MGIKEPLIGVLFENKSCWRAARKSRCYKLRAHLQHRHLGLQIPSQPVFSGVRPGFGPFRAFFSLGGRSPGYRCTQKTLAGAAAQTLRPVWVLGNACSQGGFTDVALLGLRKSLLIFISFLFLFRCTSQHVEFIISNLRVWTGRLDY